MVFLCLRPNHFRAEYVLFSSSIRNTSLKNGMFTKLLYSDNHGSMTSIYIEIPTSTAAISTAAISTAATNIPISFSTSFVNVVSDMERKLLEVYESCHSRLKKTVVYRLRELLENGRHDGSSTNIVFEYHHGYGHEDDEEVNAAAAAEIMEDEKSGMDDNITLFIKICGVWESHLEYGLTFKIVRSYQPKIKEVVSYF